jgi:hypothetical protein
MNSTEESKGDEVVIPQWVDSEINRYQRIKHRGGLMDDVEITGGAPLQPP